MQIAGVMIVRDEADIIRTNLLHHLSLGLSEILVIDNGSTDQTSEILRELGLDFPVHTLRYEGAFEQARIFTILAREAVKRGADWVLPIDADEFWITTGRSLSGILERTTAGALQVDVINFVQDRRRLQTSEDALLTMNRRVETPFGPLGTEALLVENGTCSYVEVVYPPKWISRASPELHVGIGNHEVSGIRGSFMETSEVFCLHAPLRSRSVLESKMDDDAPRIAHILPSQSAWHLRRWGAMSQSSQRDEEWAANSYVEDGSLEVKGEHHPLSQDNRLVDAARPWIEQDPARLASLRKSVPSPSKVAFRPRLNADGDEPEKRALPPALREVGPPRAKAGTSFNRQVNGKSAIWVECENAVPGTTVLFDGVPLETQFAGPNFLTAILPSSFYRKPGAYKVRIENQHGRSQDHTFIVEP